MNPLPIIGAVIAGVIGALIWGAISYYAQVEVGYVAWGIGLLVGWAAHRLGGEGAVTGIVCAAIALGSMLLGKGLAYHYSIDQAIVEEVLPEAYQEEKTDAAAYQAVKTPEELKQFLIDRGFTDQPEASGVSDEEVAQFEAEWAGRLEQFAEQNPSFETWKNSEEGQMVREVTRAFAPSVVEGVKDSIGPIDLIFGLLGVSTAFRMAMAEHHDEDGQSPLAGGGDAAPHA